PAFHRHAEATTAELFYDLFFVANLTTFTSLQEINNHQTLTAYIGFFSLLWLTWYSVSLYDVRFSSDSVFERVAKAIHFGVMVGFAVIGPSWKPGEEEDDYKVWRAFGFILMVSRITLASQYAVTLWYTKKYKRTIIPLALIVASSLVAAIIYGALTAGFPKTQYDANEVAIPKKSQVYIGWYIIGIFEIIVTIGVSSVWRVISFKGTHFVQRMSLLTLIILGEGIIVICKAISKIVKNDFLWTAAVVGQVIAAVSIIYFLYMLYFDRMQEEHFGSIKQQIWSFLHFPLHITLVLVLQGISILVIWQQLQQALIEFLSLLNADLLDDTTYTDAETYAGTLWATTQNYVFQNTIPKGVDITKANQTVSDAYYTILYNYDNMDISDGNIGNQTAYKLVSDATADMFTASSSALFDLFGISLPKEKGKKVKKVGAEAFESTIDSYAKVFELVFIYVFVAGGLALILTTVLGFLSLPKHERKLSTYIRMGVNGAFGLGLCLVTLIKFDALDEANYLFSAWMIPTICIILFLCVIVNHAHLPK
ncbi:hypothetical protein EJ04DRAFT_415106, partial [Polyplosphaeria fusca]